MSTYSNAALTGGTIDLNSIDLGEGPIFVDLDINTAGALTPDNQPSQDGVLRIGEQETPLLDVENILGSDRDERLFGSEEDGFIFAGGGDDTVHPFNGDDIVQGGAGVDTLLLNAINGPLTIDLKRGFANTVDQTNDISGFENVTGSNLFSDRIAGDRNDNVLSGGAGGDDTIKGKNGDDTITGEAGDDRLHGGRGDDVLDGGDGDDRLSGGKDDDVLTGGGGSDKFVFRGRWDDDEVTDLNFEEGDVLKISGFRKIGSEDELITLADILNDRSDASATITGDDLTLRLYGSEVQLVGVAADWDQDVLLS